MRIDINRVEQLLAEKGLTKTALSEKSGISRQGIYLIMIRGDCKPVVAGKLAKGLGVSVTSIMKEEN